MQNVRSYLVSKQFDFWCLGGISILAWALMLVFQSTSIPSVVAHKGNLPVLAASLALFVNFPHFMASYDLAYSRGVQFIKTNWFNLLFVPMALLAVVALAWFSLKLGAHDGSLISNAIKALISWGVLNASANSFSSGQLWMGLLVNMMYFTVGWHYSKQIFGCAMVYAKFEDYSLNNLQRNLIRYNVLSVWWITFFEASSYAGTSNFYDLQYPTLTLWDGFRIISNIIFFTTLAATIYFVVYRNWRAQKKWPPLNFAIPVLAFYVWWLPGIRVPELYISMVPLFHSLQYMVFVTRIKTNESYVGTRFDEVRLTRSFILLVLTGWCAFELFPNLLDQWTSTTTVVGITFFLISSHLFINIHHYFIDNVIWKLRDGHVRKSLFGN